MEMRLQMAGKFKMSSQRNRLKQKQIEILNFGRKIIKSKILPPIFNRDFKA